MIPWMLKLVGVGVLQQVLGNLSGLSFMDVVSK